MRISTSAGRSKNKVYRQGSIPPNDVSGYVQAYARDGRCGSSRRRKIVAPCLIVEDMEFNAKRFRDKLPIRLLAVGGEHSIPNMGEALQPYFSNVKSMVIADSGHFVPEEQPEALAGALNLFLQDAG